MQVWTLMSLENYQLYDFFLAVFSTTIKVSMNIATEAKWPVQIKPRTI